MSQELGLLRLFCDDRAVETIHNSYVAEIDNLEREFNLLFNLVHQYYEEYPNANALTHDDLLVYYELKYPKARGRELHIDLITTAFNMNVNRDLIMQYIDHLIEKHHAAKVMNKLMPILEGDKYGVLDNVREDIDSYVDLLHNPPARLVVPMPNTATISELVAKEKDNEGIPWHLAELTDTIGGCRRKSLGLIYAFVDAGKTSFSMASCANFAKRINGTDKRIVYCGNEEDKDRLSLRLASSLLGWTKRQVLADHEGATKEASKLGFDNVYIFDEITAGEQVEYILKEYKPIIAYVDQSTDVDIKLSRKRDGVEYYKALYKWYRGLAGTFDVAIIGVAQGTGNSEDTKYLKLSDIFGSRVVIQGALDYAIGIGRLESDPIDEDQRYINIPKNKLGDGDSLKFAAMFNRYTNEWRAI